MPARQIKPKPIPPFEYSVRFTTASDIAAAQQRTGTTSFVIIGVLLGVILVSAYMAIFGAKYWGNFIDALFCIGLLAVVIPFFITFFIRQSDYNKILREVVVERLRAESAAEQETASRDASTAAAKVEVIYGGQKSNLMTLHELLAQTGTSLKQAQQLFSERAYTPFWDSIEDAVESLRQFDKRINCINYSAKKYYANLEGREHTFPAFPLESEDLPNPTALVKQLAERIAEAQRDFQFASIFEQRRTTSAIITGFRNTQEAITSLRNDIVSSLSDLQGSLESGLENISSNIREGFDDLAESHEQSAAELRETLEGHAGEASKRNTKHQKFTEDALDNIQNRRKPRISETKEPFRSSED